MSDRQFHPASDDGLPTLQSLLSGIQRSASRLFTEAWQNDRAVAWIWQQAERKGAFATLSDQDYVVCYAAFEMEPTDPKTLSFIHDLVSEALAQRQTRPLFYNLRGDNHSLIAQARQRGFKQDTLGYELICRKTPEKMHLPEDLVSRGFEAQHLAAYLCLLDSAFDPLVAREGGSPGGFTRERDTMNQALAEKSAKGEFSAFWRGDQLVGLYYLKEDLVDMLAVAPRFQKQGYGSLLLWHATDHILQEAAHPAAYLFVVAANQEAQRLYRRLGYTISGFYSENTYVGMNV